MYSMVLMAALTTAVDMPDRGRRGGCCGGCYGGGWGGCYGGGGGCYGGWGGGFGMGGCGGGWGGGCGGGGYTMGGWGGSGYSGYALGNFSPTWGGYAYSPMSSSWGGYGFSPMYSTWGTPIVSAGGTMFNPAGLTQSFYYNPSGANANAATIIVHMPANASLSIDGQQTQQRSNTRTFVSPPLDPNKTYTYTLRAETSRDGRTITETKNVDVRAGQSSEVTLNLEGERINASPRENQSSPQRTPTPPE